MEFYTLNNGLAVPAIGFGTYHISLDAVSPAVHCAAEAGYRLFDTASFYQNERELGAALRETGLARGDYQIVTKCWRGEMGYEPALAACKASLARLGTDYVDCYLIHWPRPNLTDADWPRVSRETWRALETLYRDGFARAIGVSNFLPHHLDNLLLEASVVPALNQLEFHPGYTQPEAVAACARRGIRVGAWSPIARMRAKDAPLLQSLARQYGVTIAQLCLRYDLQKGVLPMPKSANPVRMRENLDVFGFTLSESDLSAIDAMPVTAWSGEHPDRERVRIASPA